MELRKKIQNGFNGIFYHYNRLHNCSFLGKKGHVYGLPPIRRILSAVSGRKI
jgi:hypothetical protein